MVEVGLRKEVLALWLFGPVYQMFSWVAKSVTIGDDGEFPQWSHWGGFATEGSCTEVSWIHAERLSSCFRS